MTVIDIILIVFAGFSLLRGLWKGAARELVALLAVCLGLLAAVNYHELAGQKLVEWFHLSLAPDTLGFLAVYLLVWQVVKLMGWSLGRGQKDKKLSTVSRLGGALFSLARAVLLAALVFGWAEQNFPGNRITGHNYFTSYLLQSADWCWRQAAPLLPRQHRAQQHHGPSV